MILALMSSMSKVALLCECTSDESVKSAGKSRIMHNNAPKFGPGIPVDLKISLFLTTLLIYILYIATLLKRDNRPVFAQKILLKFC